MRHDKVIWFAIVFSTFIYAGIIYTISPRQPEGSFEDALKNPMTLILYVLAFGTFVAALVVPGTFMQHRPARLRMVVSLALFEACAVYGLMAAFMTRDWRVFVPTWIVGLIGMWRVFPSSESATVPV